MTDPDLIIEIVALTRVRRSIIAQTTAISNRLGGQLRGTLGFHTGLSEAERAPIVKRAKRIRQTVLADKPPLAEDAALVAVWAGTIRATAEMTAPLEHERKAIERKLAKLATRLPAADFVDSVAGFGLLGFGVLVGECPGLGLRGFGDFATPAKLWKRLGLEAPSGDVIERQIGRRRRSSVFCFLYEPLVRAQWRDGRGVGVYGQIYGEAKTCYMQRVADTADLPDRIDKVWNREKWSIGRADLAARRYMAKRLIRDLWSAWHIAEGRLVEPALIAKA